MTVIFRNSKIKTTAAEKYFVALGLDVRQVWQRKTKDCNGEILCLLNNFTEAFSTFLKVEAQMIQHGLVSVANKPTWNGHKYLFAQYNAVGDILGYVVVTLYNGNPGLYLHVCPKAGLNQVF